MRLHVDKEGYALYLRLDNSKIIESEEVAPGVILDYNEKDEVVGVEMLYLSRNLSRYRNQLRSGRWRVRRDIDLASSGNYALLLFPACRWNELNSLVAHTRSLLPSQLYLDHSVAAATSRQLPSCIAVYPRDSRSRGVLRRTSHPLHCVSLAPARLDRYPRGPAAAGSLIPSAPLSS